jgi:hypothetical protein
MKITVRLQAEFELLICEQPGGATDLNIVFGQSTPPTTLPVPKATTLPEASVPTKGKTDMATKKATGPSIKHACLAPKGSTKPRAVMPGVILTNPLPESITLQPLDANGVVIVLTPADSVTDTLTSDSPNMVITQGTSPVNFTGTILANTPQGSIVNLAATMIGTIQGAPANLTASVQVTLDIPPSPVAVDLQIIFG